MNKRNKTLDREEGTKCSCPTDRQGEGSDDYDDELRKLLLLLEKGAKRPNVGMRPLNLIAREGPFLGFSSKYTGRKMRCNTTGTVLPQLLLAS